MSDECVFAELDEPGEPWGFTPRERRIELNKRYNDKAEKIVGRRLLREEFPTPEETFPEIRGIGEVFGGDMFDGITTWLEGSCSTPRSWSASSTEPKRWISESSLPPNWEAEKKRIYEAYGKKPPLWRHVRGPVTLAMSIYGVENLIYLIADNPDLARRFSQVPSAM